MSLQQQIQHKLSAAFAPVHVEVINESHKHSGPPDAESHFKVVLVSQAFSAKRPVARHQMIYQLLAAELQGPVHALALHTYTEAEWRARAAPAPASPDCLGGSKHDSH